MMYRRRHYVIVRTVLLFAILSSNMACPPSCGCIWKGGKQTTECVNKNMNDFPSGIDTGTQVLDFSGNNVKNVSAERFQKIGLVHLQKIFLSRCLIMSIDDKAFRALSNLVELDLSHNALTTIPSATFPDYPSLMKLTLNGNPIRVIKAATFYTLRYLVSLELNRCQLTVIETDAFAGLLSLEWLKLEHNLLKHIPGINTLPNQLHGIALKHNPWFCDCLLLDMYHWLNKTGIPETSEPMCDGPQRLRGAPVKLLDEKELACPPDVAPASLYLEIAEGKNVSLQCKVHSVPEAKISWRFKDRVLLNNSIVAPGLHLYYYLEDGTGADKRSELYIYNVNSDDNGTFVCQAENPAGTFRANYTIKIILREEEYQRSFNDKPLSTDVILALSSIAFLLATLLTVCLICFCVRCKAKRSRLRKKQKTKELALYGSAVVVGELADDNTNDGIKLNGGAAIPFEIGRQLGPGGPITAEQTSGLLTYPTSSGYSVSSLTAAIEQNPDLISDTEKDRSNSHSGGEDSTSPCGDAMKVTSSPPSLKNSAADFARSELAAGSSNEIGLPLPPHLPVIVCVNHLQPTAKADVHLMPGPSQHLDATAESYYPLDYGLPRLAAATNPLRSNYAPQQPISSSLSSTSSSTAFYRTLPHRRHNNPVSGQSTVRYTREAEFATPPGLFHPAPYEHYRAGLDVRYNVQGYPTSCGGGGNVEFYHPSHYPRVTFSDTVRVLGTGGRHMEVTSKNVCKAVQVGQDNDHGRRDSNDSISLVHASAQTTGEPATFDKHPVATIKERESIDEAKEPPAGIKTSQKCRQNESPDEGYVGESVEN